VSWMFDTLAKLDGLKPETLELIGTAITAMASLIAAAAAAAIAHLLSKRWLSARDRQDREAEWRNHAIELTKLDLERKLRGRRRYDKSPIRPSILDFLANYRDLQELGTSSPTELYKKIGTARISAPPNLGSSTSGTPTTPAPTSAGP